MTANLVLKNGNFYTMDRRTPKANAVAIHSSRIVAVGRNRDVETLIAEHTEVIDLEGKTVIPGMTDCHAHFIAYALKAKKVDLIGTSSIEEVVQRVKKRVMAANPGRWILGGGWDKNLWEGDVPNKDVLDTVSSKNPVALRSRDGHTLWVNSLALAQASITKSTPNPEGGVIERNPSTGEATGILKENAIKLVQKIIPVMSITEMEMAVEEAIRKVQRLGIVGIHDYEGRREFLVFQNLHKKNALGLRVFMMIPKEGLDSAIQLGIKTGLGDPKLRVGALKIFADGALGSQTATMLQPYEGDRENLGIVKTPKNELKKLVQKATTNGIGVAIHAIGDRANRDVLDIIEENQIEKGNRDLLYRIEHAQHLSPEDIKRFKALGVIASMQPLHITFDMKIADKYLGERSIRSYQFRSLLDAGATLAFGSDCPVAKMNPLLGIYAAVTRRRVDGHPLEGWHPKERISVEEAVKAYTIGAAVASGFKAHAGSITVGKLADLVVLSKNLFEIPEVDIWKIQVDMIVFDGKIVYRR